jgi:phosphohistidine phosphatase
MKVYIVRHGIAADPTKPGDAADAERPLTSKGRCRARLAAKGLRAIGCRPGVILASPLLRALQSADILADVLRPPHGVKESPALRPGADPRAILDPLAEAGAQGDAMLVGHMPHLALAAAAFVSNPPSMNMVLGKAGACCISFDGPPGPGTGMLEWLLEPRHLRRLA